MLIDIAGWKKERRLERGSGMGEYMLWDAEENVFRLSMSRVGCYLTQSQSIDW